MIKTNDAFRKALAEELAAVRGRTSIAFFEPVYDRKATEAVRDSAVRAVGRAIRSSETGAIVDQVRTVGD